MKFVRIKLTWFTLLCMLVVCMTSCDKYNYTDELQGIGHRVEILEESMLEVNVQLAAIKEIFTVIQEHGYITNIEENADGTYTITFNNNNSCTLRNGYQGTDGQDGKEADLKIGAALDPQTGIYFWTLNGEWLLDNNGNKVQISATDGKDGTDGKNGKDGQDGKDGKDGADGKDGVDGKDGKDGADGKNGADGKGITESQVIIPIMRINNVTRNWEISVDNGGTWTDTGFCADGKDGVDGKDGADGKDGKDGVDGKDGKDGVNGKDGKDGKNDIFVKAILSDDKQSVTFVLADGSQYTVPVIPDE